MGRTAGLPLVGCCCLLLLLVVATPQVSAVADWPLLQLGSNGVNTYSLQDLLNYRGFPVKLLFFPPPVPNRGGGVPRRKKVMTFSLFFFPIEKVTLDGLFGYPTKTAVTNFQSSRGLSADGLVGTNTWRALCPVLNPGNRFVSAS